MAYAYPLALALLSVGVAALERLWPWRKQQRGLRRSLASDLVHLVFNGHFLGVLLYGIATWRVLPHVDRVLASAGLHDDVYRNVAAGWPLGVQILVALFAVDLVQWCVHNLLHRVPWLWELHKTHHSVVDGEMDWIVSFRFHWAEVVVYRAAQYLPLAFFGFAPEAMLFHAVFGTLIGHLNHANLDVTWGPLKYLLNSPRMHLWHHDRDARRAVNFGIVFSLWDWLFGTAKLPEGAPARLGFADVERFPADFFSQTAWPFGSWLSTRLDQRLALTGARVLGVALLAIGWWLHLPP